MSPAVTALLVLLLTGCVEMADEKSEISQKNEQERKLKEEKDRCMEEIESTPFPTSGIYCNMTFDNVMCWPYTPAGTVYTQPCPHYISNIQKHGIATRRCMENGTWYYDPVKKKHWTNYTACVKPMVPDLIKKHLPTILLIARLGYSISLAVLILAITLMLIFKRLHCQRNVIHVNLFLSFALRAFLCLLKDTIKGSGTSVDNDQFENISRDKTNWECKLLFTLLHYALGANYMWIFVEGLYLHTLIILAVFSHKKLFKWYILFGWLSPLVFVIPWVIVRVYLNNTLCWDTHQEGYYWILKAPIIASIFVNFFFFINIIRVLFTKLMANNNRDPRRYRKLAKSTLVLIPLFGVHYIIFIIFPDDLDVNLRLVKFYMETILNSFLGVIVAFLFCFLNGEVRAEIVKLWTRHRLRRDMLSGRTSRAFSTTSNQLSLVTHHPLVSEMATNIPLTSSPYLNRDSLIEADDNNSPTKKTQLNDTAKDIMKNDRHAVKADIEEKTPMLQNGVL